MKDLALFFFLQRNIMKNHLRYIRRQSTFKVVVVSIFSVFFWCSIFLLFYSGFKFFWKYIPQEFFGLIVNYLFALFYFSLFVMLFFSSTIIALSVLFREPETAYLVTSPIPLVSVFLYKVCETFVYASWAVFFLGLPVCFAYGMHLGVNWLFYPLVAIAFIPFTLLPAILGSIASLLIVLYVVKWRRSLGGLFLAAMAGTVVWVGYSIVTYKEPEGVFSGAWLLGILNYLEFARLPFLPPMWISSAMNALVQNDYLEFGFQAFLLTATVLFLINVTYVLADRSYGRAWSLSHSYSTHKNFWRFRWMARLVRCFFFLQPKDRLFLEKDVKIFLRDPLQWGQFAILLSLLLLYTLNLRTLRYDQQSIFWRHVIATLNLTATGLTICTFASRFVFPMLSLEGKRFWTLGIMPIRRSMVIMAKFTFAAVTLLVTSEMLIFLSCYMLRLPWQVTAVHMVTMMGVTFGVAGLAVGLGAVYPNFREDSPAKIVSGFGGTLNLVLSLLFVLLLVAIQVVPSHLVLTEQGHYRFFYLPSILAFLLTSAACLAPLYWGIHHFGRAEL